MEQHLQKKGVQIHYQENQEPEPENDGDEALSLCDLPTNEQENPNKNHSEQLFYTDQENDFAFGASSGSNQPKNKMCTADELFYRGQILPLRHSVTLPSRLTTRKEEFTRSVSISEPVSAASSRSSSTRSSASVTESERNRNRFHSHPSPSPQIRTRSLRQTNTLASKWRLLQLGPMKVEEIGLADLKNRRGKEEDGKKKQVLSFSGCKCTADVVERTVSVSASASRIRMVKPTTLKGNQTGFCVSKESNVGRRKHVVSSHRTSEWLKQLFVLKNDHL